MSSTLSDRSLAAVEGPCAHVVEAEADEAFGVPCWRGSASPIGPSSTRRICSVERNTNGSDGTIVAGAMELNTARFTRAMSSGPVRTCADREVLRVLVAMLDIDAVTPAGALAQQHAHMRDRLDGGRVERLNVRRAELARVGGRDRQRTPGQHPESSAVAEQSHGSRTPLFYNYGGNTTLQLQLRSPRELCSVSCSAIRPSSLGPRHAVVAHDHERAGCSRSGSA